MDDSMSKNSCIIQRVGEIIKLGEQAAVMLINGKQLEVPLTKIAGGSYSRRFGCLGR
jgi:hypothetical protein